MEKKLVFGAIGLMFGNAHLEGALAYGAEVAAICDLDPEVLRKSGEKYNRNRCSRTRIRNKISR